MNNGTASELGSAQFSELASAVIRQLPRDIDLKRAQELIEKQGELKNILRKALVGQVEIKFPTWKIIKLGTCKNIQTLCDEFNDCHVSKWAKDMLDKTSLSSEEKELELVRVSVSDLGFKNEACHRNILVKAEEFGLRQCPAEAGPQLRAQYSHQPLKELLVIAMEDYFIDTDGDLHLFTVGRDQVGFWLDALYIKSDTVWEASTQFVFCR